MYISTKAESHAKYCEVKKKKNNNYLFIYLN